jgi:hypothetical protein
MNDSGKACAAALRSSVSPMRNRRTSALHGETSRVRRISEFTSCGEGGAALPSEFRSPSSSYPASTKTARRSAISLLEISLIIRIGVSRTGALVYRTAIAMHAFDSGPPIRGHCRPDAVGTTLISFREAIRRNDFVVTAELPLVADQTKEELTEKLSVLQGVVDAVQVGGNEGVDAQIAELAAARIAYESGVDAVVQLSASRMSRVWTPWFN